jgi:CO dehydrogenase/acetyl-CoA synthase alpha subunit
MALTTPVRVGANQYGRGSQSRKEWMVLKPLWKTLYRLKTCEQYMNTQIPILSMIKQAVES